MSNGLKCLLLRGYAGSGKSFKGKELAEEWGNTVICSADDYWIDGKGNYCFDVTKLANAHNECYSKFKEAILSGKNVIVDNTNLKYDDCTRYFDFVLKNNNLNQHRYAIDMLEVSFNSIEKAIEYRSNRTDGKNIPADRMRQMHKAFKSGNCIPRMESDYRGKVEFIFEREVPTQYNWLENTYKTGLNDAIICDLDGTISIFKLSDGTLLRNAFNAETSNTDLINVAVAKAISALELAGNTLIFVSGRESKYREPTMEFLNRVADKFGISKNIILYMRETGDFRSDDIVKTEIYNEKIEGRYNVIGVFDDRPRVVRVWRSLGLFVFDCNYRGEDF